MIEEIKILSQLQNSVTLKNEPIMYDNEFYELVKVSEQETIWVAKK